MQDVAKSPLSSVAERSRSRRGDLGVRFMLMLMPEKSFPDELKSVIGRLHLVSKIYVGDDRIFDFLSQLIH